MEVFKTESLDVRGAKSPSLMAHEQPWFFQKAFENESFQTTGSEYYTIEIITAGNIVVGCDEDESYTFHAGDVWLSPGKKYSTISSLDYEALIICFDSLYYAYCLYSSLPQPKMPAEVISPAAPAAILAHSLQNDIDQLNPLMSHTYASIMVRSALHQLAHKIFTLMPYECLPVPQSRENAKFTSTDFSYFLEANYLKRFTVTELGSIMGKSLSSFKRFFGSNYQSTPVQWLIQRRLEQSYFLLSQGHYSVETVAVLSGFAEVSHFVKQFKKRFGLSPRILQKRKNAHKRRSTWKVTNLHPRP